MRIFYLTGKYEDFIRSFFCTFLLVFCTFYPLQGLAWNSTGHRLIALIAWDHLAPTARTEATQLLHNHPDFDLWVNHVVEADVDRGVFIEASIWPDTIRKDKRFYSAGIDEPTPILPGFPDMERHRDWHFINLNLDVSPFNQPISGLMGKQLVVLINTLASDESSQVNRSYALPWFFHLVGDAHQPLHTSIRQEVMVNNPFNPRKPVSSLHAFWDDLPGPSWLRGERLEAAAHALIAAYPPPAHIVSSDSWIIESWQVARNSGYPTSTDTNPTISADFFEISREIANRRITEAGYRLAHELNRLFTTKSGSH